MRKAFPGYCKIDKAQKKELWSNSTIVFDTNVLLNLYRYSDETREDFIKSISAVKDRLWLPYRCAEEFLKNRTKVISDQQKSYDKTIKDINDLIETINSSRSHPFISKKSSSHLSDLFKKIEQELLESQKINSMRITEDEIKDEIFNLFDGRVSEKPSLEYLEKVIEEGEKRYQEKIPPGYKDVSKVSDGGSLSEKLRPYGDFLIWKCILEYSKEESTDIIFITDDNKEDWWEIGSGKTVGPRPELVEEMRFYADRYFLMYKPTGFLKHSKEAQNEVVSKEALEEVREVSRPVRKHSKETNKFKSWLELSNDFIEADHAGDHQVYYKNLKEKIKMEKEILDSLNHEFSYTSDSIRRLQDQKKLMEEPGRNPDEAHLHGLSKNIEALAMKLSQIKNEQYMRNASVELMNQELAAFKSNMNSASIF